MEEEEEEKSSPKEEEKESEEKAPRKKSESRSRGVARGTTKEAGNAARDKKGRVSFIHFSN